MTATSSGFFIQSSFGAQGNFEAVVPGRTTGLLHLWRNNDVPAPQPWSAPQTIATGVFDSASLIQSNFGAGPGNLEVVALQAGQLLYMSRTDQPPFTWSTPTVIATGAKGNPALIQSRFGTKGNFELVVPQVSGGLAHYWRDNDGPLTWHGPIPLPATSDPISGVALMQSNFGTPGNLEVIACAGAGFDFFLLHYWRDDAGWHGPNRVFLPAAFGTTNPGFAPGFIQSSDGNFQVVHADGGHLTHVMRDNSDPSFTWNPVERFAGFPMTGFNGASVIQSNFGSGNFELLSRKHDAGPALTHVQHHWREPEAGNLWQQGPGGDILGNPFF